MTHTFAYEPHTEQVMREYYHTLHEKDRRRYAAVEAQKLPHGGIGYIADVLGCCTKTIQRGLDELNHLTDDPNPDRVRQPGAGRPKKSDRFPS